MKIFTKEQIYEGDKITTERQHLKEGELRERAGTQVFNWLDGRMQGAPVPIHVFCGIGNNGADGLVLARHLILHGYNVKAYIVNSSDKRTKEFLQNYEHIKTVSKEWPTLLNSELDFPQIQSNDIIVDAIFGIGLNRPIDAWVKALFIHFRTSRAYTLSIDIPSGLFTDRISEDEEAIVTAGYTLSYQTPKLVFFLPETHRFTEQWQVIDIGIEQEYLYKIKTEAELIAKNEILPVYKPRLKFSDKTDLGHGLIIGGSYGKIGAVNLASKAVLSAGAGKVSAYTPKSGYLPLQIGFPEVEIYTDEEEQFLKNIKFDIEPTVIGIGVGLGNKNETIKAFEAFLKTKKIPLVIDGDALNYLATNKKLLELLPENTVLTPNPTELLGLIGEWENDFDKLNKAKAFTLKYQCVLVIKGANTITVYGEKLYINATGNPGLSTTGTGAVLTGMITGLIAQGYEALESAIFANYLHGKAADLALQHLGYQSLIASDVINYISEAYLDLFRLPEPPQATEETQPEG